MRSHSSTSGNVPGRPPSRFWPVALDVVRFGHLRPPSPGVTLAANSKCCSCCWSTMAAHQRNATHAAHESRRTEFHWQCCSHDTNGSRKDVPHVVSLKDEACPVRTRDGIGLEVVQVVEFHLHDGVWRWEEQCIRSDQASNGRNAPALRRRHAEGDRQVSKVLRPGTTE